MYPWVAWPLPPILWATAAYLAMCFKTLSLLSLCAPRFGEVREALVDNGKRAALVQQSKPVRPIRRR